VYHGINVSCDVVLFVYGFTYFASLRNSILYCTFHVQWKLHCMITYYFIMISDDRIDVMELEIFFTKVRKLRVIEIEEKKENYLTDIVPCTCTVYNGKN